MRRNGFTLIELLAVILILGIITLIAIPVVSNIVSQSRMRAFEASINNIVGAIEDNCQLQLLKGETITTKYTFADGEASPSLNVGGKLPESGTVTVDSACKATLNVTNGKYTAIKTATEDSVTVVNGQVYPTVTFGTNGNSTYAKSRSTIVNVSDGSGVEMSNLKYQWTTSSTAPLEESFTTSFTNGSSINTPSSGNGGYYLWVFGKNKYGNTIITRSNVFNLDNTVPVITMLGVTPINANAGSTYTDAGATATDNIDGTITAKITTTSTVNVNALGSYTVTYNVSDSAGNSAIPVVRAVNVADNNNPIVTANSTSYTITKGTSSVLPGTYFTINKNGLGNISTTVCVDTSNGNTTVTNISTLAVGTHVIKCTVTKDNGLSANASTTIAINNYSVGQAVTYASINWHVVKLNGTNAMLLADSGTIASRRSFDTTYNASYPSCPASTTGYCGTNVWSASQLKTYLNSTWLSSTTLSTTNLVDDGNGYVRLLTSAEYTTLKAAVGSPSWLYSGTISWWWTMTASGTYKLNAVTDAGALNSLMEAFDLAYVRPVIILKQ